MSSGAPALLRTLAFGDLDTGAWGCAWGDAAPVLAVGGPRPGAPLPGTPASISGSGPDEEWTVSGEGVELVVSPVTTAAPSSPIAGFDQLCRVHGTVLIDGAKREVALPGHRGSRLDVDLPRFDSVRELSAWFAPGDGIALTSLRPRGAKGHDRDINAASVFEPAGPIAVSDPRVSTTYAASGQPTRLGLELWLDEEGSEEQYPRRLAAEPLGASAVWARSALELEAYFLRCLSRGEEGLGVYVVGRPK